MLQFDRLVPNTWRVANTNDAVASVPRMLGYCHVRVLYSLLLLRAACWLHAGLVVPRRLLAVHCI